jgi:hypothetical protein
MSLDALALQTGVACLLLTTLFPVQYVCHSSAAKVTSLQTDVCRRFDSVRPAQETARLIGIHIVPPLLSVE